MRHILRRSSSTLALLRKPRTWCVAALVGGASIAACAQGGDTSDGTLLSPDPAEAGLVDAGLHHSEGSDGAPSDGATENSPLPPKDAAKDAPLVDAGKDASQDTGPAVARPTAGELLVTEIMFNPSTSEPDTEWFEVYSLAGAPRSLNGLTLRDGAQRTDTIAASPPVILAPQTYALLVRKKSAALAASLPPASILYDYGGTEDAASGILLTNSSAGAITILDGTAKIAEVSYGGFSLPTSGRTLQLKGLAYAGLALAGSWCGSTATWPGSVDMGTPGAASDCP